MAIECMTDDDPLAGFVCRYLQAEAPDALEALDTGLESTVFAPHGTSWRPVRTRSGSDSYVSTAEIYGRILEVAPSFVDPAQDDDARLNALIRPQAERIRAVLAQRRLTPGSLEYTVQFHRLLMGYVTLPARLGGLGVQFDREVHPPRTPSQVLSDRRAACLDFVTFYRLASEEAGAPLASLELFQNNGSAQMHVAMGIFDPATHELRYVVDLQNGAAINPPRSSDVWSEISRRELVSYFYNARAARNPDTRAAEADLDFALRLNPGNYLLLFNKAYYAADAGRLTEARDLLQRSIAANPTFSPAYMNLNQVALRLRDQSLADRAWAGYSRSLSR